MTSLDDVEFVRSFEACRLRPERFHHSDHVRLAWLLLGKHPLPQALARFSEGSEAVRSRARQGRPVPRDDHVRLSAAHPRASDGGFEGGDLRGLCRAQPGPLCVAVPGARALLPARDPGFRPRSAHLLFGSARPARCLSPRGCGARARAGWRPRRGPGREQVGEGNEQGQEADEAEAEGLGTPASVEALASHQSPGPGESGAHR